MTIAASPILHSKTRGDVAEAYVTARLLELGKTVLKLVGDNARYDLVIHDPVSGQFQRVQCKTGYLNSRVTNVLQFPVCSSSNHVNQGKRDYRGDVDCFAVWFTVTRLVYLVPVAHVGTSEASLRLAPARNGQTRGIRLAAEYVL